ncbi:MAG: hypothetical protein HC915_01065 [Anaerolineae bacterium]|nr:hypothetical protein [Anaerolineae bacterium]
MDTLAQALWFSPADLAENQLGRMTTAQQARFQLAFRRQLRLTALAGLALTIFYLVLVLTDETGDALRCLTPFFLGVMGVMGYTTVRASERLQQDILAAQVVRVQGSIQKLKRRSLTQSISYWIICTGLRFRTSQAGFLAFQSGEQYTLYIAPHTQVILSAEHRGSS